MSVEEFRAVMIIILLLVLVIVTFIAARLLVGRGLEFRVTRIENEMGAVAKSIATSNAETAALRTEMRGLTASVNKVENMVGLIFQAALERGQDK